MHKTPRGTPAPGGPGRGGGPWPGYLSWLPGCAWPGAWRSRWRVGGNGTDTSARNPYFKTRRLKARNARSAQPGRRNRRCPSIIQNINQVYGYIRAMWWLQEDSIGFDTYNYVQYLSGALNCDD